MSGWTVMLRGISNRLGRSVLVLIIATVATAAAVSAVAYMRSAQQSVLTDALRSAPTYRTDIVVGTIGGDATPANLEPDLSQVELLLNKAYATLPVVHSVVAAPIAAEDTESLLGPDGGGYATFGYRAGVCAYLTISGQCASQPGQVMVSARTADQLHLSVGDKLSMQLGVVDGSGPQPKPSPEQTYAPTIVGIYTPKDAEAGYWYGDPYFSFGQDANAPNGARYDTVFAGSDEDIRHDPQGFLHLHLEVPIRPSALGTGDVAVFRTELNTLGASFGQNLAVSTGLSIVLDEVASEQHALSTTIPVAAVPLVVLALFVLFLVVAALGEERAPELALAKLRGFTTGAAARFGSAEMLTLILLSGPLGFLLGVGGTDLAAHLLLAPGTGVELRGMLYAAAAGSVVVGALTAWFATRTRLRQGVLDLIRRAPARAGRRASVALGLVIALLVASLVAAYLDRSSPIAWLAAPSIAIIAGLVGARLLSIAAARRLSGAARRGLLVGLISGAWVARQPGRGRVVAVLTTAVALLVFGAIGWDVAAQARHDSGVDTLGADRVYDVAVGYPGALIDAVHAADPSGNAIAVAWTSTFYDGHQVPLYAVESKSLAKVALWRGEPASQVAALAARLVPAVAPRLTTNGQIGVTATVAQVPANTFALDAVIEHAGQPPVPMSLGMLHQGTATYSSTIDGCSAGCRFLGFALSRYVSGVGGETVVDLKISNLSGGGISVGDFSNAAYWSATKPRTDGVQFTVTPGPALGIRLETVSDEDESIAYEDTPTALPVVVSGGSKDANRNAGQFTFPSLDSNVTAMTVVGRTARIPSAGTDAILADLGVASSIAERTGTLADTASLTYQVWADPNAPADLGARLATHGVTVRSSQTVEGYVQQMARSAPTLSFWFYLVSGAIALLLAIGVVLLGTYVGAEARIYGYAALRLAGVPAGQLRKSLRREYRSVLGISLIVGVLAGGIGALLMLPGIPLVTAGGPHGDVPYGDHMVALYAAVGATIVVMVVIVALAVRVLRRATPERLREGVR